MYAFLAGVYLIFIGYSLREVGYLGLGMLILGVALIFGSLIVQARKGRDA